METFCSNDPDNNFQWFKRYAIIWMWCLVLRIVVWPVRELLKSYPSINSYTTDFVNHFSKRPLEITRIRSMFTGIAPHLPRKMPSIYIINPFVNE
mmetsp:Transcript_11412/g.23201  ORF Transcript_11412/g.23201 Transcript_11412/m.23201 type:complete len:95 (-) Transcript_11412:1036-1320(-)